LREITHGKESFLDASFDLLLPFYSWTDRERKTEKEKELGREIERVLGEN
jgi:hypothetical protein